MLKKVLAFLKTTFRKSPLQSSQISKTDDYDVTTEIWMDKVPLTPEIVEKKKVSRRKKQNTNDNII